MQKPKRSTAAAKEIIGWRENVDLPDLGLFDQIAKIDTGARTSSMHVDSIEPFSNEAGQMRARIVKKISHAGRTTVIRDWNVPVHGFKEVRSSNGMKETRAIIKTTLKIGDITREVEFTLTNRKLMRYEILIGRRALRGKFLVNPSKSYLLSPKP